MKKYMIKKTKGKGNGLFASKGIKKGELIFSVDLSKQKVYTAKEIRDNPKLQSDHCDYIGKGKYIISFHPYSYMNHSCNPTVFVKGKGRKRSYYTLKNIKKGEELTYDYGAASSKQEKWIMKCKCGSKNCRKIIRAGYSS